MDASRDMSRMTCSSSDVRFDRVVWTVPSFVGLLSRRAGSSPVFRCCGGYAFFATRLGRVETNRVHIRADVRSTVAVVD